MFDEGTICLMMPLALGAILLTIVARMSKGDHRR